MGRKVQWSHSAWEKEISFGKQIQIDSLKAEMLELKLKIDRVNSGFTDGSLDSREFKELKNPLIAEKTGLEQKIIALETSKLNRLEPLKTFISEANTAQKWVKEENWMEMKSFLQKVGSNRLLKAQTLTVTFKKPASLLAETVLAVESSTLESERCSRWWGRWELDFSPRAMLKIIVALIRFCG